MYWNQELLRDHYASPRNKGMLASPSFLSEQYNPSCGDKVQFSGLIRNSIVEQLMFEGQGCVISVATASLLTTVALGKSISDILSYDATFIQDLICLQLGPVRLKCALLSLTALQQGLTQYVSAYKK